MKLPVRILLILLCAGMIASLPFILSAPNMLDDVKMKLMNEDDGDEDEEEIDFGRLFFSTAYAEDDDLEVETMDEDAFDISPEWVLPLDLTAGPKPNPGNYTENGYEDASIRVKLEEIVYDEKTTLHVAYIQIADASQFRTGVVNPSKLGTTKTETVAYMAKKYNAVIALNGDYYVDDPDKTTFEYRMTTKIRGKRNRTKDILIIDDAGDFHFYIKSKGLDDAPAELKAAGRKLVNGFTFGPALIAGGELLDLDDNYGYNPHGHEPRTAIGQTGPLSYVFVVVSCKGRNDGSGLSHSQLAEEMLKLGCINAYNLDGGNSAEMIFGEKMIKGSPNASQRGLSDIIYFATLVPEE